MPRMLRISQRVSRVSQTTMNDIDLKRWRDYEHLRTSSFWKIDRDDTEESKGLFIGRFVRQIPLQLIERFTKAGEVVIDPFIGSGTTIEAALLLDRKCLGIDIDPKIIGELRLLRGGGPDVAL